MPKQVGYVDCGAPFVNHLYGNANSDMGAAAPSGVRKEARGCPATAAFWCSRAELAACTKVGQFNAFRLALLCDRPGDEEIKIELMPDRLHPNAHGQRLMAHCIGDALRKLDRRKAPGAT